MAGFDPTLEVGFDADGTNNAIKICAEAILPQEQDLKEDCDIRNIWGFWFQVFLVLSKRGLENEYQFAIALTKKELLRRGYFDRFMAEIEYPEYAPVRNLMKEAHWF
jgi:hypothetical protein